ncbi:MAG TPA: hypothetical protein VHY91_11465 [Pirellulales bacterium]|nr:hypothetical protein [Pirellulales bacterium]
MSEFGQDADMLAGEIRRGDEQANRADRLAVETFEIDAELELGDCAERGFEPCIFGVRDRDTASDAGRAKFFAFQNRCQDALAMLGFQCAHLDQAVENRSNRLLLRACRGLCN